MQIIYFITTWYKPIQIKWKGFTYLIYPNFVWTGILYTNRSVIIKELQFLTKIYLFYEDLEYNES